MKYVEQTKIDNAGNVISGSRGFAATAEDFPQPDRSITARVVVPAEILNDVEALNELSRRIEENLRAQVAAEAIRWADEVLKGEPGGTTPRGILGRSPMLTPPRKVGRDRIATVYQTHEREPRGMAGSPNRAERRARRRRA